MEPTVSFSSSSCTTTTKSGKGGQLSQCTGCIQLLAFKKYIRQILAFVTINYIHMAARDMKKRGYMMEGQNRDTDT